MGDSNGDWGDLVAHDDSLAAQWDGYARLPDPGENDALDAFCEAKHISIPSLVRLGAKLSAPTVLAFAFPGGVKYRDVENGNRWSAAGSEWTRLKIVRAGVEPSDTVIVAEGETDGARLTMLYSVDVAVLPAGAKGIRQEYADQLSTYGRVLIGLDNDEAGQAGAAKLSKLIPHAQRFAAPEGVKDWCALDPNAGAPPLPDTDAGCGTLVFRSLLPAFRGELPAPSIAVDDLIYDEGVHWISGHPGSGKSLLAMMIAQNVMCDDRPVVWLDYEQGERMTGQRLREMDVDADHVERLFHWTWWPSAAEKQLDHIARLLPSALVVVDSASKALSAAGIDENSPGEVTEWTSHLIRGSKTHRLPVLVIDHVAKDAKNKNYARGAGAKLADTDVHWIVNKIDDFNRETIGTIKLHLAKDREGYLPEWLYYRVGDGNGGLPLVPTDAPVSDDGEPSL
ncbi:MAG: AAA family ATPase [Mycobacteriaceae bacterium]